MIGMCVLNMVTSNKHINSEGFSFCWIITISSNIANRICIYIQTSICYINTNTISSGLREKVILTNFGAKIWLEDLVQMWMGREGEAPQGGPYLPDDVCMPPYREGWPMWDCGGGIGGYHCRLPETIGLHGGFDGSLWILGNR